MLLTIAGVIYYCFMHKNFTFVNLDEIIFLLFLFSYFLFVSTKKFKRKKSSKRLSDLTPTHIKHKYKRENPFSWINFSFAWYSRESIFFSCKNKLKMRLLPSQILSVFTVSMCVSSYWMLAFLCGFSVARLRLIYLHDFHFASRENCSNIPLRACFNCHF